MLSNTATPKYYGEFKESVLRGDIPVNAYVSMQMNLIDYLISRPEYYYDPALVEGYISYCEDELTLTDGSDLFLLPSFKLWAEDLFGWWYFVESDVYNPTTKAFEKKLLRKRLRRVQYLILGRGGAKSIYMSTIQNYILNVDTTTTRQMTCAPVVRQTEEVLNPIKTSIVRARGPVFKLLTDGSIRNTTGSNKNKPKLISTKKGIENTITNSLLEAVPMSIDKLQGRRDKCATVDEWLSCEIRENPITAIEQGASKNDEYTIIAASSEGNIRNGVGDTIKIEEILPILKGEVVDFSRSIWYYCLDDESEVAMPQLYPKCNPNIGYTVGYDVYQAEVNRMERAPSTRNEILAKRFGIAKEGCTYFFTYEETLPSAAKSYWGLPCALGADMSRGDDFCAFTFLFPLPNGDFGAKTRSYITRLTYNRLGSSMKLKYDEFVAEGTLVIMDTPTLKMDLVYEDLYAHIESMEYDVRCVGYDPYNAKEFVELWVRENGPYNIDKVPQGFKTESVPLGEIKTLMENRLIHFDESIMSFGIGNAVALVDTNGNRKLYKQRRDQKIDNVAALLDAFVAFKTHAEEFE